MNNQPERPTVADGKVPWWIKIMWIAGIAWILGYIALGLQSTPATW
jgi:hypothetical protein